MPTTAHRSLTLAAALAASGCSLLIGPGGNDASESADGGGRSDASTAPFAQPVQLDISPTDGNAFPSLNVDETLLFFSRENDIWMASRASRTDPWTNVRRVDELSSNFDDSSPEITSDGLDIYFASTRNLGTVFDIYHSSRPSIAADWTAPTRVDMLSSIFDDRDASPSDDLLQIIVTSNRDNIADRDMFIATRSSVDASWPAPTRLEPPTLDGTEDGNAHFSANRTRIVFDADSGSGGAIFVATRAHDTAAFGEGTVIAELSSPYGEAHPWLSRDGRRIYFASKRDGDHQTGRLYMAERAP